MDDRVEKFASIIESCILGGAVGDTLGAEIEFWDLSRILSVYPQGVVPVCCLLNGESAITDDTQMTLFTAEGLTRALLRGHAGMSREAVMSVHAALLRWYGTQFGVPRVAVDKEGLFSYRRLHQRRAPGTTCMSALGRAQRIGDVAQNDSKGAGTVMRIAPVAFLPRAEIGWTADAFSALTHAHATARDAAAAWALLLHDVAAGMHLEDAARRISEREDNPELRHALQKALRLPRDGSSMNVHQIGGGWVAEEAVAVALYAALCAHNFEHGLRIAVTHSGDSDTTGAIAGNLLGLMFPDELRSHPWTANVECRDIIHEVSVNLARSLAVSR